VSEQNVELHRRLIAAFNARDLEAIIAKSDPQIEYDSMMTVPGGDVYRGHEGMRRYFRDMQDAWGDEIRAEPEAYFDLGQHTLAVYVLRGRGQQSGAEVAMPFAQVIRWRDGLMLHFKAYPRREDALRDLGMSEESLEPIAP
jgi:ketosteroid isomerase-like protein